MSIISTDIRTNLLRFKKNTIILFTLTLFFLSSSSPAQEARYISYNADTNLQSAITVSPDGRHIYAGGFYSLATFERQPDGSLKTIRVFNNDHRGFGKLYHIADLAVSPDGLHLYAVDVSNQAILIFFRDLTTGALTLLERMHDPVFASEHGSRPTSERHYKLLISPNGKHLYWLYSLSGILVVFQREEESGSLTKIQAIHNRGAELGGFDVPRWLSITPDGKHFYGAGGNRAAILILSHDENNGRINFEKIYDTSSLTHERLWNHAEIMASQNNETVYVRNLFAGKIFVFSREFTNGDLELLQTIDIYAHRLLADFSNGKHLYFVHYEDYSYYIAHHSRNSQTDQFDLVDKRVLNYDHRNYGLPVEPSGISASPFADAIYLTSETGQTVIKRDTTTHKLDILQHFVRSNVGGTDRLSTPIVAFNSQDGEMLYTDGDGSYINQFERDPHSGRLTLKQTFPFEMVLGELTMSPDSRHFYSISRSNRTIDLLARDEQADTISFVESIPDSLESGGIRPFSLSPDGLSLYVTDGQALTVYSRNPATGSLTFVQKIHSRDYGLESLSALDVSPDGNHFYWNGADFDENVLHLGVFERNQETSELTFTQKLSLGLRPSFTIRVAPDGRHVYAGIGKGDDGGHPKIVILARDSTTGELTSQEIFDFPEFRRTVELAISADGGDVYAAINSSVSGGLLMLTRDQETGRLTVREYFKNWHDGVQGLASPFGMVLSPDHRFLYVTETVYDGIVTLATGQSLTTNVHNPEQLFRLPRTLTLEQNYPNPFLSSSSGSSKSSGSMTTIRYEVPASSNNSIEVELSIFNTQGQLVQTLVNEAKAPGRYSINWNGRNAQGEQVPSGVYFYRVKAGELVATKRLVIVR